MVQSHITDWGIKPASLINVFSYSGPNVAVGKLYCLLSFVFFKLFFIIIIIFFLQNDVEAPAYLRTPGYAPDLSENI